MKTLLYGIALIVLVGVAGLLYRNAVEHPSRPIACPLDAKVCPDGTAVGRTGLSCTFPACPPPNVLLADVGIAYAIPDRATEAEVTDPSVVAAYDLETASGTSASIVIRRFEIASSSTALATIRQTAVGGASGEPVPSTGYSSKEFGTRRFTVVSIERFEGVIDTAYYLARTTNVLRFDAIDRGADWTNPNLNVSALPAHAALEKMLGTLQGQ